MQAWIKQGSRVRRVHTLHTEGWSKLPLALLFLSNLRGQICRNIWVEKYGDEKYRKPIVPYVWKKEQHAQFLTLLSQTLFPIGYVSSNVRRKNENSGLKGLKTHNYHVMIEDILPIEVISSLEMGPRLEIIRLYEYACVISFKFW